MSDAPTQRAYRAACPNCGAPVEFRSAASAFAVCSFCKSQVVRDGEALRRIGQGADLFDDHSPLQLGAAGRLHGEAFTLVGRLQYRYAEGTWNEWHALFDNGRSAWLSEDNGRYVAAFDTPLKAPVPPAERLRAGTPVTVDGAAWSVASVVAATLIAAQGELPVAPRVKGAFVVADLRNPQGEVGTLDYSDPAAPGWSIGRSVALAELAMTGLAAVAEKTLSGRSLQCPNCGNGVEVKLGTTQSVVCGQCRAVIDVSQGVGGDLAHFEQEGGGSEPLIPLGSIGALKLGGTSAQPRQVVGYAERCDVPESDEDEQTFWREYLLYHRTEGFAFLVDSEDGWSWVVPLTGVPEKASEVVRLAGVAYKKQYTYKARVTWVLGEFYWKLARGQEAQVTDYKGVGKDVLKRLSREETRTEGAAEVVWSGGEAIDAETVRTAFKLPPEVQAALKRDASPASEQAKALLGKALTWGFIIAVAVLLTVCDGDGDDCSDARRTFGEASAEYRNCIANRSTGGSRGGGSYGGFSSGGSHK